MQIERELCPKCQKPMDPLTAPANPESSEWYCAKDHKSVKMDVQTAKVLIEAEMRQMAANARR